MAISLAGRLLALSAATIGSGCSIIGHVPTLVNGPGSDGLIPGLPETAVISSPAPASALGGQIRSGTAFFVSRGGLLLTSAHLVSSCEAPTVWWRDRPLYSVVRVAIDRRRDLALLATGLRVGSLIASPSRRTPQPGDLVTALGFAVHAQQPLAPVLIRGYFAGSVQDGGAESLVLIRAHVPPGASGGPVVDDSGNLIGMVVGYYSDRPDFGVVTSNRAIADFLAERGIRLQHAPARTSFTSIDRLLRGTSALVQCPREHEYKGSRPDTTQTSSAESGAPGLEQERGRNVNPLTSNFRKTEW